MVYQEKPNLEKPRPVPKTRVLAYKTTKTQLFSEKLGFSCSESVFFRAKTCNFPVKHVFL